MTNEFPANLPADENLTPSVSQRLRCLADRANEAHKKLESALKDGLFSAYEAGKALLEAFEICPKRKWVAWLAANCKASRWTARRYMDFAMECDQRFGVLPGETLHEIPSDEAGSALKKLTLLPSGRKKQASPGNGQQALPSIAARAALSCPDAPSPTTARPAATVKLPGDTANPYLPLKRLFEELMEGFRSVMSENDSHDREFAELLLLDLKPVYADLLDYLEDRDRLRRTA